MSINRAVSSTQLKRLDSSSEPKEIDLWLSKVGGDLFGTDMKGIYKFEGNRLIYCWAHPDEERPTDFTIGEGSNHTLVCLEAFSTGEDEVEKTLKEMGVHYSKDNGLGWIEYVKLNNPNLVESQLKVVKGVKRLKSLESDGLTDELVDSLAAHQYLASLYMYGESLTNRSLATISKFKNLRAVGVRSPNITDEGMGELAKTKLTRLILWESQVTAEGIKKISDLPITSLTISSQSVDEAMVSQIVESYPELYQLGFRDCELEQAALAALANLQKLQSLHLTGSTISDEGVAELKGMSEVVGLYLDRTSITDKALASISQTFPKLKYLSCKEVEGITEAGLDELEPLKKLHYFWVSPGKFDSDVMRKFNDAREHRQVRELR